jgi:hypothetical protein
LTGFALSIIGKVGNKQEWPELLKRKGVFRGVAPTFFIHQAFTKAVGQKCTVERRPLIGNVCKEALGPSTGNPVYDWMNGQIRRLNFTINDLVRQSDALQMELNRVKIPMPPKFKKWIVDLRDTAVSVSSSPDSETRAINCFRLWELTAFKGELVTDFQIIRKVVNKEIAAIEKEASATIKPTPAKPAKAKPIQAKPAPGKLQPRYGAESGFVPPDYQTQVERADTEEQGQEVPAQDEKKLPGWVIPAIGIASAILFKG